MVVDRTNNSADKVVDYAYQYYDANGKNNNRIRQITDNIETAYSTTYTYDDYNRLTNATANAFSRSYSFDEWGNIKNFSGLTLNYQTNASGAPTTNRIDTDSQSYSYTYDAAGNMTVGAGQSYTYDGANRLKEVGTGGANVYGYDGDGKRVKKTEGGTTTYYVYSSNLGQSVMEVTASSVQRAYVYGGGKAVAMQSPDGQFYWLHKSHLGNSRAMTDWSGNLTYKGQFDPYGQTLTEWSGSGNTNLNTKKFTGYERDSATGLDYANARMYNSTRGRFTVPDMKGLKSASVRKPQSLNRYAYTGNDPVNFVDPSGLDEVPWVVGDFSVTINGKDGFSGIDGGGGDMVPLDSPSLGLPDKSGSKIEPNKKLPDCATNFFKSLFPDLDFDQINIYTDGLPYIVQFFNTVPGGAGAFTFGNNIYFSSGEFNTSTNSGLAGIAHELVHVRQFKALGTSGFSKQYIQEYLTNISNQLGADTILNPPRMPDIFDITAINTVTYLAELEKWLATVKSSYSNLDFGKAYENISFEKAAAGYELELRDWLNASPGRNPCAQ